MSGTSSLGQFTPFQAAVSIQNEGDGILTSDAESQIFDNHDLDKF